MGVGLTGRLHFINMVETSFLMNFFENIDR